MSTEPEGLRVLVVDDDPLVRRTVVRMLQSLDGEVTIEQASSAQEGVDTWNRLGAFDLVLVDHEMPGENGIWCIRNLRQLAGERRLVALLVTGHPPEQFAKELSEAGGDGVVTKPIRRVPFLQKLTRLLGRDAGQVADPLAAVRESLLADARAFLGDVRAIVDPKVEPADPGVESLRARAHRLAGTLGSYGHPALGEAVKELELCFTSPGERIDWPRVEAALASAVASPGGSQP